MFQNCTSLANVPALPATTIGGTAYSEMFKGCSSIVSAQNTLPCMNLTTDCYKSMFSGCTSLQNAPVLPATKMAPTCSAQMVNKCEALTDAPVLPAMTLAKECYSGMFQECTSLEIAPVLPALTLVEGCYAFMYSRCTSLRQITAMFIDFSEEDFNNNTYTLQWIEYVPEQTSGSSLFIMNKDATWDPMAWDDPHYKLYRNGDSGVPAEWSHERR